VTADSSSSRLACAPVRFPPSFFAPSDKCCPPLGVAILDAKPEGLECAVRYTGHESEAIAYGADFVQGKGSSSQKGDDQLLLASCSFYDRTLHLWRPPVLL
jgi:hypothetical protein